MIKKEELEDIKLLVEELTYEYIHDDTFYGLFVDIDRESIDLLIEQAEIGVNADKDKQTLIKSNIELNARVRELEKDIKEWEIVNEQWEQINTQIAEQNKRYQEALEFYADEETYESLEVQIGAVTKEGYKISKYKYAPIINTDKGKKARKALEGDLE